MFPDKMCETALSLFVRIIVTRLNISPCPFRNRLEYTEAFINVIGQDTPWKLPECSLQGFVSSPGADALICRDRENKTWIARIITLKKAVQTAVSNKAG